MDVFEPVGDKYKGSTVSLYLRKWLVLGMIALCAFGPLAHAEGFSVGARFGLDYPFTVGLFAKYETNLNVPVGVRVMVGAFTVLLAGGEAAQVDVYAVPLVTDWGGRVYVGGHGAFQLIQNAWTSRTDSYVYFGVTLGYETPISSDGFFYAEFRPAALIGLSIPGSPTFAPGLGVGFGFTF
jgi:hypothetical protein